MIDFEQDRVELEAEGQGPLPSLHEPHWAVLEVRSFLSTIIGCEVGEIKSSTFADLNKIQGVRRSDHLVIRHRGSEFTAAHADTKALEQELRDWKKPPRMSNTKIVFTEYLR